MVGTTTLMLSDLTGPYSLRIYVSFPVVFLTLVRNLLLFSCTITDVCKIIGAGKSTVQRGGKLLPVHIKIKDVGLIGVTM